MEEGSIKLVVALIMGMATFIVAAIIGFVIVQTMVNANLLQDTRETVTIYNEAGHLNATGYTLDYYDAASRTSYSIVSVVNGTDNATILAANYTLASGVLSNITTQVWNSVYINYTYIQLTPEELTSSQLAGNFSSGVDNVSSKVPTIMLVAAILLIISILAVLVALWRNTSILGGQTSI